jgi:hypothetical protein
MGSWSSASLGSLVPISGSPTLPRPFPSPRSSPPFATASASENSSAAGFVLSTRPRLTSPSHRAKPSFLRGLHCVVNCWIARGNAIPSASLHLLKVLRVGGGGGHHQVPRSSLNFHGSRHFRHPAGFCAPTDFTIPPFRQGFPPIFWGPAHFLSLRASPPIFGVPPTFWVPPIFRGPRSGFHPRSVRRPRSFRHLTTCLSVTRLPVCPSPTFGLSVTQVRSVRHPTSVCPSPDFGLSVTQPRSVRHPTSVCLSLDPRLHGFSHVPSQRTHLPHGP